MDKKIWMIVGIIIVVIVVQQGIKKEASICTAPENAQVIYRTNVNPPFEHGGGIGDVKYIALNYDVKTQSSTSDLKWYGFRGINAPCTYNFTSPSELVLPYSLPGGQILTYNPSTSSRNPFIFVYEPFGCVNSYTRSWYDFEYVWVGKTPNIELSLQPTEPFTSSCRELYEAGPYQGFVSAKSAYLNGGSFNNFIASANQWIVS